MIVVHHLEASRSQRVLWALEELGLDYEVRRYARDPKTSLGPPELKAVHPLGKSPVVTDGDRTLAESGAILEYLVGTYGAGRLIPPAGSAERDRYTYWLHYAEGSAMPPLLLKLIFTRMQSGRGLPFFARPLVRAVANKVLDSFVDPNLTLHLDWIEAELGRSTWFAGEELTAADIQMSFPVEAGVTRAGGAHKRPRMAAFVERIHARPAFQRAIAKGGPFEILG
ncbi:MAG: glutathione S-transferase [Kofleriaceae bacterium]